MHVTLREQLEQGKKVRLMGAHDGLSAILAERHGFEGIWASGLAISSSYGLPDSGILTLTEIHAASVQMRAVCSLPIVADIDSGFGDATIVPRVIRSYESAGIDAVCIEDKQFPKRNSFVDGNELEEPDVAAGKIEAAKRAQTSSDFMVIARQESLIAGAGIEDALARAKLYVDAGADALLIHSRASTAVEIEQYCSTVRAAGIDLPIVAIPTTYYRTTASELWSYGVSAAVYANQLIRASVKAMEDALDSCTKNDSTELIETDIASLAELFSLVGMDAPVGSLSGSGR